MSEKIDVVICTLNSVETIKKCLESVFLEIPVNRIVVVDGGSTDGTLEVLSNYPQIILYVKPELNLGESRAFAFTKVSTPWFALIDSDIELLPGWFKAMEKDMVRGDLIEGGRIEILPFKNNNPRGRFLNSVNLIKTEAVKGVQLPCTILEDELTRRIAESRGYKIFRNGNLLALHRSDAVRYRGNPRYQPKIKRTQPLQLLKEVGRVDRLGGVKPVTAIAYFSCRIFKIISNGIWGTLIECLKATYYLWGYFRTSSKPVTENDYSLTLKQRLERDYS